MGAYYLASNNKNLLDIKELHFLKLMEHGYFYDHYVGSVLNMYRDNPQPLVWLCDYYCSDDEEYDPNIKTWNELETAIIPRIISESGLRSIFKNFYILNHTQKLFIDTQKLLTLYKQQGKDSLIIHPIPILTNSNKSSMGGGDYHREDSRRGTWRMNIIELKLAVPNGYTDVTENMLF